MEITSQEFGLRCNPTPVVIYCHVALKLGLNLPDPSQTLPHC